MNQTQYGRCSKCKELKPPSEFWRNKRSRDKLDYRCKSCVRQLNKNWRANNPKSYLEYSIKKQRLPSRIFSRLKYKAIKNKILFDFTKEEFTEWYEKQDKKCVYCGITMFQLEQSEDSQMKRFKRTLSIDRKIPDKGYSGSNIVLACLRCNLIKNDFFSFDEMMEIGDKYVRPKHKVL